MTTNSEREALEKWYGYAGHLIVGKQCAYHLCTRVGKYLISTVGHYLPRSGDKMDTVGAGSADFFETHVFPCDGETADGNPNVTDWDEIGGERYATSVEAERGHYKWLNKYRAHPSPEMVTIKSDNTAALYNALAEIEQMKPLVERCHKALVELLNGQDLLCDPTLMQALATIEKEQQ